MCFGRINGTIQAADSCTVFRMDVLKLKGSISTPIYAQIALDVASRIARGELKENTKIYGRSLMSSEYGVSPETIRRALKLLADTEIVDIKHNSGVVILSQQKARSYVEKFSAKVDILSQQNRLKSLMTQRNSLDASIVETVGDIISMSDRFSRTNPFQNYDVQVPEDSHIIGKTLSELAFWQRTGATIIAIRRGDKILLSPGPYVDFAALDTIVFVGDVSVPGTVKEFIELKNME